jgi:hypothetical protein
VLVNLCHTLGFNYELFNVQKLNERYGNEVVNTTVQISGDYDIQIDSYEDRDSTKMAEKLNSP